MKAAALIMYLFPAFISLISFGLVLFRFKLRAYLIQICFTAFVVANVCYLLQVYQIDYLTAVIQPVIILFGYWLLFKIRFLYSLIIVVILYSVNGLYEYLYQSILSSVGITLNFDQNFLVFGTMITIINFIVISLLKKFRIGFSFIPANKREGYKFKGNSKNVYILCILTLLSICLAGFSLFFINSFALIAHCIVLLMLGVILGISYIQEVRDI